jgi:hypothetical protein
VAEEGGLHTELDDLGQPARQPTVLFFFDRDARFFSQERDQVKTLTKTRQVFSLAPDQLFHAPVPLDAVVRLGKMRVSEFLPDGREVTRAILQAGAVFRTRPVTTLLESQTSSIKGPIPESEITATGLGVRPEANSYDLADIVLTSLGEGELWLLPAGILDETVSDDSPSAKE